MYYQVNDVRLFVADEGDKSPALLFIHFWGGSSRTWQQVTHLLRNEYRCIRFDQRGWGDSDKPQTGYHIRSLAADVLALVQALQLDDYILVGHSMGGKIAQAIAAQKPKGLRKLVLVAPSPALPTVLTAEMQHAMTQAYASLEGINATIDHVFKAADLSPANRAQVISDMQKHCTGSRMGWPGIALQEDVSAGLESVEIPTLVIAGENDEVDPPARLEAEVVSKIPAARMVVVQGVGHLAMLQAPEKIAQLIRDFCRQ